HMLRDASSASPAVSTGDQPLTVQEAESILRRLSGSFASFAGDQDSAQDEPLTVSTLRDIRGRKVAEPQPRKLEARYRALVEGIPAVTFMAALDDSANELYVSPQIEAL